MPLRSLWNVDAREFLSGSILLIVRWIKLW